MNLAISGIRTVAGYGVVGEQPAWYKLDLGHNLGFSFIIIYVVYARGAAVVYLMSSCLLMTTIVRIASLLIFTHFHLE